MEFYSEESSCHGNRKDKIILSETTRPRAMIVWFKYHLVDFYLNYKNLGSWVRIGPT